MASYRDGSGKIVIDSAQAAADIKKLTAARDKLTAAQKALAKEKATMEPCWIGESKTGFDNSVGELNRQISSLINQIDASIRSINNTVATYKAIDKKLSQTMGGKK